MARGKKKEPESGTKYVVRAVTLPVAAPVGRTWEELNPMLRDCFDLSTHAANWCIQQLYRRDTVGQAKTPDAVKMGKTSDGMFYALGEANKCARCGLRWSKKTLPRAGCKCDPKKKRKSGGCYCGAPPTPQCRCGGDPVLAYPRISDWDKAIDSLGHALRYAHREYLRRRFDVMVRCKQNLLTVRYPYPFPVRGSSVELSYADGGFPVASIPMPGLGNVSLRLRRRADLWRQLAGFKQLHDGTAVKCEAALYRNNKGDLLLKLVGQFPVRERMTQDHVCLLYTDPAAFLVAEIDGRSPWVLNADHLKRWAAVSRVFRQRYAEDTKREKRMDRRERRHLNKARELRVNKHNNRVKTAVGQLTAQVARFCERQGVACVVFDDTIRDYLPEFPWFYVQESLSYKLEALGIQVVARGKTPTEEFKKWLTNRKAVWALALAGKRLVEKISRDEASHPAVSRL